MKKYFGLLSAMLFSMSYASAHVTEKDIFSKAECPSNLECHFFKAPKDYNNPKGEMVDIYYGVHKATRPDKRKGVLFLNFGGPCAPAVRGASVLASDYFPKEVVESFDIVGMDPRGSGFSAFAKELTRCANSNKGCDKTFEKVSPFMGTNSVARDMDILREILGEEQINYLGFSYGTRLGSIYTDLFPDRVRAVILDANMSPFDTENEMVNIGRSGTSNDIFNFIYGSGAEKKMLHVVKDAFYHDGYLSQDNYLLNEFDTSVVLLLSLFQSKEPLIQMANAFFFQSDMFFFYHFIANLGESMEDEDIQVDKTMFDYPLPKALANKKQLLRDFMFNNKEEEEQNRSMAMFQSVMCTDEPLDVLTDEDEIFELYKEASELYGLPMHYLFNGMCRNWKAKKDPIVQLDAETMEAKLGDKKVLLYGIQYDTNTPYFWSQHMQEGFGDNAVLVTVDNIVRHCISFIFPKFDCVNDIALNYLLNPNADYQDTYCEFSESMHSVVPLKSPKYDFPLEYTSISLIR